MYAQQYIVQYKYCYNVIKVQIYTCVPSLELLLPTLKRLSSHVKTGNFDLILYLQK